MSSEAELSSGRRLSRSARSFGAIRNVDRPIVLLVLVASFSLAAAVDGCGGGSRLPASGTTSATYDAHEVSTITTKAIPTGQRVRGDGDADNPSDIDGNGDSDSARVGGPDNDVDTPVPESYRFPDSDDREAFAFGHSPGSASSAINAVVKRYFAAAAAEDGASGCRLLIPSLASTVPDANVGANGAVRGRRSTCAAALQSVFTHYHGELEGTVQVASIRVKEATAQVIVTSRTLRAGEIFLTRQSGSWWIEELLSRPLS